MNIILYWIILAILLLIASYGIYVITLKYFEHTNIVFSITNFIIFFGIAYLFRPENIFVVIIEEIGIIFIIFLFQKIRG